ncbi:MAG: Re/Si-specific NAD(P)(+) transhydrogenase subunit alpha [Piscirickettsiaceae bacterium]|nr:Re/Si-specific NAD(P)(+) transhydrogenase subunit alpha [Piscirickettsiaceae bacterium]
MKIGIPKELCSGEKRVATTPKEAKHLMKLGFDVYIEKGAGLAADIADETYIDVGVKILDSATKLWHSVDIIIKVRAPSHYPKLDINEFELIKEHQHLICYIWPAQNNDLMKILSVKNTTVLAMDSIPRLSRAQNMDALSSMANISGYRAVIEASQYFGRFFTGQITAAGRIPPAKILVIGAGVAGLSAIGVAKSMGAIVRAFDTRLEVKEQIESMDAEFLTLIFNEESSGSGGYAKTMSKEFIEAEVKLLSIQAMEVDIIITTALIPGKPAPQLITADMVKSMKPGSVIVDVAAEFGGNCVLTKEDTVTTVFGVTIIGYTDLPSRLANQASQLYATNLRHLLTVLRPDKDSKFFVDMDDDVIRGATVIKDGLITWPPPKLNLSVNKPPFEDSVPSMQEEAKDKPSTIIYRSKQFVPFIILAFALYYFSLVAPESLMTHFTVFILSCFIGYQVIWNVSSSLHTPLMSVTNAISGIVIIGALTQISESSIILIVLSTLAILLAAINIVGGFLVTRRMLDMFRK